MRRAKLLRLARRALQTILDHAEWRRRVRFSLREDAGQSMLEAVKSSPMSRTKLEAAEAVFRCIETTRQVIGMALKRGLLPPRPTTLRGGGMDTIVRGLLHSPEVSNIPVFWNSPAAFPVPSVDALAALARGPASRFPASVLSHILDVHSLESFHDPPPGEPHMTELDRSSSLLAPFASSLSLHVHAPDRFDKPQHNAGLSPMASELQALEESRLDFLLHEPPSRPDDLSGGRSVGDSKTDSKPSLTLPLVAAVHPTTAARAPSTVSATQAAAAVYGSGTTSRKRAGDVDSTELPRRATYMQSRKVMKLRALPGDESEAAAALGDSESSPAPPPPGLDAGEDPMAAALVMIGKNYRFSVPEEVVRAARGLAPPGYRVSMRHVAEVAGEDTVAAVAAARADPFVSPSLLSWLTDPEVPPGTPPPLGLLAAWDSAAEHWARAGACSPSDSLQLDHAFYVDSLERAERALLSLFGGEPIERVAAIAAEGTIDDDDAESLPSVRASRDAVAESSLQSVEWMDQSLDSVASGARDHSMGDVLASLGAPSLAPSDAGMQGSSTSVRRGPPSVTASRRLAMAVTLPKPLDLGPYAVDIHSRDRRTLLETAALYGDGALVTELVSTMGAGVNARGPQGTTPLLWAATAGQEATIRLLLRLGADPSLASLQDGRTPLIQAVARRQVEAVQALLDGFRTRVLRDRARAGQSDAPEDIMTLTSPAMHGVRELLRSRDFSGKTAVEWLRDTSQMTSPPREMVFGAQDAISSLLDAGAISRPDSLPPAPAAGDPSSAEERAALAAFAEQARRFGRDISLLCPTPATVSVALGNARVRAEAAAIALRPAIPRGNLWEVSRPRPRRAEQDDSGDDGVTVYTAASGSARRDEDVDDSEDAWSQFVEYAATALAERWREQRLNEIVTSFVSKVREQNERFRRVDRMVSHAEAQSIKETKDPVRVEESKEETRRAAARPPRHERVPPPYPEAPPLRKRRGGEEAEGDDAQSVLTDTRAVDGSPRSLPESVTAHAPQQYPSDDEDDEDVGQRPLPEDVDTLAEVSLKSARTTNEPRPVEGSARSVCRQLAMVWVAGGASEPVLCVISRYNPKTGMHLLRRVSREWLLASQRALQGIVSRAHGDTSKADQGLSVIRSALNPPSIVGCLPRGFWLDGRGLDIAAVLKQLSEEQEEQKRSDSATETGEGGPTSPVSAVPGPSGDDGASVSTLEPEEYAKLRKGTRANIERALDRASVWRQADPDLPRAFQRRAVDHSSLTMWMRLPTCRVKLFGPSHAIEHGLAQAALERTRVAASDTVSPHSGEGSEDADVDEAMSEPWVEATQGGETFESIRSRPLESVPMLASPPVALPGASIDWDRPWENRAMPTGVDMVAGKAAVLHPSFHNHLRSETCAVHVPPPVAEEPSHDAHYDLPWFVQEEFEYGGPSLATSGPYGTRPHSVEQHRAAPSSNLRPVSAADRLIRAMQPRRPVSALSSRALNSLVEQAALQAPEGGSARAITPWSRGAVATPVGPLAGALPASPESELVPPVLTETLLTTEHWKAGSPVRMALERAASPPALTAQELASQRLRESIRFAVSSPEQPQIDPPSSDRSPTTDMDSVLTVTRLSSRRSHHRSRAPPKAGTLADAILQARGHEYEVRSSLHGPLSSPRHPGRPSHDARPNASTASQWAPVYEAMVEKQQYVLSRPQELLRASVQRAMARGLDVDNAHADPSFAVLEAPATAGELVASPSRVADPGIAPRGRVTTAQRLHRFREDLAVRESLPINTINVPGTPFQPMRPSSTAESMMLGGEDTVPAAPWAVSTTRQEALLAISGQRPPSRAVSAAQRASVLAWPRLQTARFRDEHAAWLGLGAHPRGVWSLPPSRGARRQTPAFLHPLEDGSHHASSLPSTEGAYFFMSTGYEAPLRPLEEEEEWPSGGRGSVIASPQLRSKSAHSLFYPLPDPYAVASRGRSRLAEKGAESRGLVASPGSVAESHEDMDTWAQDRPWPTAQMVWLSDGQPYVALHPPAMEVDEEPPPSPSQPSEELFPFPSVSSSLPESSGGPESEGAQTHRSGWKSALESLLLVQAVPGNYPYPRSGVVHLSPRRAELLAEERGAAHAEEVQRNLDAARVHWASVVARSASAGSEWQPDLPGTEHAPLVPCLLGCGTFLPERDRVAHELMDCERRMSHCPLGCGRILPACDLAVHMTDGCELRRLRCPMGCGSVVFACDLAVHIEGGCLRRVMVSGAVSRAFEADARAIRSDVDLESLNRALARFERRERRLKRSESRARRIRSLQRKQAGGDWFEFLEAESRRSKGGLSLLGDRPTSAAAHSVATDPSDVAAGLAAVMATLPPSLRRGGRAVWSGLEAAIAAAAVAQNRDEANVILQHAILAKSAGLLLPGAFGDGGQHKASLAAQWQLVQNAEESGGNELPSLLPWTEDKPKPSALTIEDESDRESVASHPSSVSSGHSSDHGPSHAEVQARKDARRALGFSSSGSEDELDEGEDQQASKALMDAVRQVVASRRSERRLEEDDSRLDARAGLLGAVGVAHMGAVRRLEDWIVELHPGSLTVLYPMEGLSIDQVRERWIERRRILAEERLASALEEGRGLDREGGRTTDAYSQARDKTIQETLQRWVDPVGASKGLTASLEKPSPDEIHAIQQLERIHREEYQKTPYRRRGGVVFVPADDIRKMLVSRQSVLPKSTAFGPASLSLAEPSKLVELAARAGGILFPGYIPPQSVFSQQVLSRRPPPPKPLALPPRAPLIPRLDLEELRVATPFNALDQFEVVIPVRLPSRVGGLLLSDPVFRSNPLIRAARTGDVNTVRSILPMLSAEALKTEDGAGHTPLTAACSGGHVDICRLLLEAGGGLHQQTSRGYTPLLEAIRANSLPVVRMLVEVWRADISQRTRHGVTAISLAKRLGHERVVQYLRTHADLGEDQRKLFIAIALADVTEVKRILKWGDLHRTGFVQSCVWQLNNLRRKRKKMRRVERDLVGRMSQLGIEIESMERTLQRKLQRKRDAAMRLVEMAMANGSELSPPRELGAEDDAATTAVAASREAEDASRESEDVPHELTADAPPRELTAEDVFVPSFSEFQRRSVHYATEPMLRCLRQELDSASEQLKLVTAKRELAEEATERAEKRLRAARLVSLPAASGHTPFSWACALGSMACAEVLLTKGADPHGADVRWAMAAPNGLPNWWETERRRARRRRWKQVMELEIAHTHPELSRGGEGASNLMNGLVGEDSTVPIHASNSIVSALTDAPASGEAGAPVLSMTRMMRQGLLHQDAEATVQELEARVGAGMVRSIVSDVRARSPGPSAGSVRFDEQSMSLDERNVSRALTSPGTRIVASRAGVSPMVLSGLLVSKQPEPQKRVRFLAPGDTQEDLLRASLPTDDWEDELAGDFGAPAALVPEGDRPRQEVFKSYLRFNRPRWTSNRGAMTVQQSQQAVFGTSKQSEDDLDDDDGLWSDEEDVDDDARLALGENSMLLDDAEGLVDGSMVVSPGKAAALAIESWWLEVRWMHSERRAATPIKGGRRAALDAAAYLSKHAAVRKWRDARESVRSPAAEAAYNGQEAVLRWLTLLSGNWGVNAAWGRSYLRPLPCPPRWSPGLQGLPGSDRPGRPEAGLQSDQVVVAEGETEPSQDGPASTRSTLSMRSVPTLTAAEHDTSKIAQEARAQAALLQAIDLSTVVTVPVSNHRAASVAIPGPLTGEIGRWKKRHSAVYMSMISAFGEEAGHDDSTSVSKSALDVQQGRAHWKRSPALAEERASKSKALFAVGPAKIVWFNASHAARLGRREIGWFVWPKAGEMGWRSGMATASQGKRSSHQKCQEGAFEATEMLLKTARDTSAKAPAGKRAILRAERARMAVQNQLWDAMARLDWFCVLEAVENGADPEMSGPMETVEGHSALTWACIHGAFIATSELRKLYGVEYKPAKDCRSAFRDRFLDSTSFALLEQAKPAVAEATRAAQAATDRVLKTLFPAQEETVSHEDADEPEPTWGLADHGTSLALQEAVRDASQAMRSGNAGPLASVAWARVARMAPAFAARALYLAAASARPLHPAESESNAHTAKLAMEASIPTKQHTHDLHLLIAGSKARPSSKTHAGWVPSVVNPHLQPDPVPPLISPGGEDDDVPGVEQLEAEEGSEWDGILPSARSLGNLSGPASVLLAPDEAARASVLAVAAPRGFGRVKVQSAFAASLAGSVTSASVISSAVSSAVFAPPQQPRERRGSHSSEAVAKQDSHRKRQADGVLVAAVLLERPRVRLRPNHTSDAGFTPLGAAASRGHTFVMHSLMLRGANPKIPTTLKHGSKPPLMQAAEQGQLKAVAMLLERGADPTEADSRGKRAWDCARDHPRVQWLLAAFGAGAAAGSLTAFPGHPAALHVPAGGRPQALAEPLPSQQAVQAMGGRLVPLRASRARGAMSMSDA
jgi:ankyrin repeat protein